MRKKIYESNAQAEMCILLTCIIESACYRDDVKVKGKILLYSLSSIGPGADPGVQAVSPQVTWSYPPSGRLPLLAARPAVTSPAEERHRPSAGTKLYCLVAEAHACEQLAQGCYLEAYRPRFEPATRACLNQFLIAIRSLTILCDHIRLKTGLIVIMQLIDKLWTVWVSVVTATTQRLTPHGERGKVGSSESVAAASVREYMTPKRSQHLPPPTGRPTVRPHWCHTASTVAHSGSLAYCATLGGATRDQW